MKLNNQPLFVLLGLIIVSVVTTVTLSHSAYSYLTTKNRLIEEMEQDTEFIGTLLQKDLAALMAAYAIHDYERLVKGAMQHHATLAIIVEDYNMGRVMGNKVYFSGKIRGLDQTLQNYDHQNSAQQQQLKTAYYEKRFEVRGQAGELLGSVHLHLSDAALRDNLDQAVISMLLLSALISIVLCLLLFTTIHLVILKPILTIMMALKQCDKDGIPLSAVPLIGSVEISSLAATLNSMLVAISGSRIQLTQQHAELKAHKDRLKVLSLATEQSPVSIIICTPEDIIEYANPQFEKTSGLSVEALSGQTISRLFGQSPASQKKLTACRQELAKGCRWGDELMPKNAEGKDYHLRTTASPILLDNGVVSHHLYVVEDISEHKQHEELLRNSQKMDAIGQLTGGIAHDFNNLLGIIIGNLELLKMTTELPEATLERLEQALAGAMRGAQLTRKLLNFSRRGQQQGQVVIQVNSRIKNLHELIAKAVTAMIQVDIYLAEDLWSVKIDLGDFEDALLNLCLNAKDAMPEGGRLVIESINKQVDTETAKQLPELCPGDYIRISVSDTGTGISKTARKKIFDPFYTTKSLGKGTGLGLSMVYGFVQRSEGAIKLYSEEGHGSSFHLYLPRAIGEGETPTDQSTTELPRGNERVLVVDDEAALADTAADYLHQLGYRVILANNAVEAVAKFSVTPEIDLLFSDVLMPEIDGFELAFMIKQQKPEIKVLLTSGFTAKRMNMTNGREEMADQLSKHLLSKPYNLIELANAVRQALDQDE